MRKVLLVGFFCLLATVQLFAQDRTITGTVTDDAGSPMPGVNIAVKGTTKGTATNADGAYSLAVSATDQTLVFSFVGFKISEITIGSQTVIDIKLAAADQVLNEVVVSALGIQREAKSLGYSVATVKTDQLTQGKSTNLATGLSAKVSGLQINQVNNGVNPSVRIVLRGNRSFLGNNQALVVLDGIQVSQDYINSVNPNDVESVTVLKGAGAAALYGSQAANGVLIITTKTGNNAKPQITFSSTTQIEKVAFLPKLQTRFGSYGGEGPGADVFNIDPNFPATYVAYENQSYGPQFNGQVVQLGRPLYNGQVQTTTYSAKEDEKRKFWDTGISAQNDLSFSGGNDKTKFYVSFQDVLRKGVMPKDQNRRDILRFNATSTYGNFKIAYKIGYTLSNADITSQPYGVYNNWANTPMQVPLTQYKDWQNDPFAGINGYYNDFFANPYWTIDNNREYRKQQDLLGNVEMSLQATKWLSLIGRAGVTNQNLHSTTNTGAVTYAPASQRNPNRYISNQGNSRAGVLDYNVNNRRFVSDVIAKVDFKNVLDMFSISALAGVNLQDNYLQFNAIQTTNLLDPNIYNTNYRYGNLTGGNYESRERRLGAYADLSLGFKEFLFVHGSVRNDWVSLLDQDKRSFSYPSVDVSFVFTEALPFLKESNVLTFGKITGSLSKVGNVSLNPYQNRSFYGIGTPYQNGAVDIVGLYQSGTIAAQGLKPEFTNSKEVDLELGFFKERLNVKAAYYQSNTINQTVPIQVSRATGYRQALINTGEMLNRGLELDLTATPVRTLSGFKWTIGANFTDLITNTPLSIYGEGASALSEININYNPAATNPFSNAGGVSDSYAIIGQQYPVIKTTDWVRDPQGRVIVDANTGLPSRDPRLKVFGQTNPRYRLGLNTSVSYKGLALNVVADYRGGNYIYNQLGQDLEFGGIAYKSAEAGRQRFVFPNSVINTGTDAAPVYTPNTNITINEGNYNFWQGLYNTVGGNYVTSGAFWKLREIALNYELPATLLQRTKVIKKASVGINGRNLFMWRPKSNQWTDPEFSEDNSNAAGRTSLTQTPPTRLFGANITLTF